MKGKKSVEKLFLIKENIERESFPRIRKSWCFSFLSLIGKKSVNIEIFPREGKCILLRNIPFRDSLSVMG